MCAHVEPGLVFLLWGAFLVAGLAGGYALLRLAFGDRSDTRAFAFAVFASLVGGACTWVLLQDGAPWYVAVLPTVPAVGALLLFRGRATRSGRARRR